MPKKIPTTRPTVFIASSSEGLSVAKAIQANLDHGFEVTIWPQGVFGLGSGTLEALEDSLPSFDFAVIVITGDDTVTSRGETSKSPRDNVILELGMMIGALGRKRSFIVHDRDSEIKLPSDLAGVTLATYAPHQGRGDLKAALGAACSQIEDAAQGQGPRSRASGDALAQLLVGAQQLRARLDEQPLPIEEHNEWVDGCDEYLRNNLGPAYVVRFSDFSGMTFMGDGSDKSKMSRSLQGRSRRIHEFMKEIGRP